jgi:hypothetical protein
LTTDHQQRILLLQSMFRKEIVGKLPWMSNPQQFAADTISVLLKSLDQRIQTAVKDPAALAIGMMNNARYVAIGVSEHDQLPSLLGPHWKESQNCKMAAWKNEYWQSTWQQLREMVDTARADAKPDVCSLPQPCCL